MAQAMGRSSASESQVTGRRVLATVVDAILILLVWLLLMALFGTLSSDGGIISFSPTVVPAVLLTVLILVYYIGMEGRFGQTFGKMLVGVKVVREGDGEGPGYGKAAIRTVFRVVDGFLGYVVAFVVVMISGKNQRLGDMAARTLVVRV